MVDKLLLRICALSSNLMLNYHRTVFPVCLGADVGTVYFDGWESVLITTRPSSALTSDGV